MMPQHRPRGADADEARGFALNLRGNFQQLAEERLDERVEPCPGGRQLKRTPLKELRTQRALELDDLRAHRRLLDAVGNFAHGLADAPVTRDVIEEFEVVDIHASLFSMKP